MPFADTDTTVFVARRPDGSIYGVWTVRQFEGQEELLHDHPQVLAFVESTNPKTAGAAGMVQRQHEDSLEALDTAIDKLPADQRAAFTLVRQLLEK